MKKLGIMNYNNKLDFLFDIKNFKQVYPLLTYCIKRIYMPRVKLINKPKS
jgi:hypothetical protein